MQHDGTGLHDGEGKSILFYILWGNAHVSRKRQVIANVKKDIDGEVDNFDGFDELDEEVSNCLPYHCDWPDCAFQNQAKVRKVLEQGHVDDEDSE